MEEKRITQDEFDKFLHDYSIDLGPLGNKGSHFPFREKHEEELLGFLDFPSDLTNDQVVNIERFLKTDHESKLKEAINQKKTLINRIIENYSNYKLEEYFGIGKWDEPSKIILEKHNNESLKRLGEMYKKRIDKMPTPITLDYDTEQLSLITSLITMSLWVRRYEFELSQLKSIKRFFQNIIELIKENSTSYSKRFNGMMYLLFDIPYENPRDLIRIKSVITALLNGTDDSFRQCSCRYKKNYNGNFEEASKGNLASILLPERYRTHKR